jgi:hypothetical protein
VKPIRTLLAGQNLKKPKTKDDKGTYFFCIVHANRNIRDLQIKRLFNKPAIAHLHPYPSELRGDAFIICNVHLPTVSSVLCNFAKVAKSTTSAPSTQHACPDANKCHCRAFWPICPPSDQFHWHVCTLNYDDLFHQPTSPTTQNRPFNNLHYVLATGGAKYWLKAKQEAAKESFDLALKTYIERVSRNMPTGAIEMLRQWEKAVKGKAYMYFTSRPKFTPAITKNTLKSEARKFCYKKNDNGEDTLAFIILPTDKLSQQLTVVCADAYRWALSVELAGEAYSKPEPTPPPAYPKFHPVETVMFHHHAFCHKFNYPFTPNLPYLYPVFKMHKLTPVGPKLRFIAGTSSTNKLPLSPDFFTATLGRATDKRSERYTQSIAATAQSSQRVCKTKTKATTAASQGKTEPPPSLNLNMTLT